MRERTSFFTVLILAVLACTALRVEAAGRRRNVVSPEVHRDGRVSFRLRAPQAKRVEVNVQFARGGQAMKKDEDGVWRIRIRR